MVVKTLMTPPTQPDSEASVGRRLGLSTSEAARHLGVSLSTIRRWSDMGYLRGYRTPGGQRRFPVQELDEFVSSLEERTNGSGRFVRESDDAVTELPPLDAER
jgi:excisionase family DNA binding protein